MPSQLLRGSAAEATTHLSLALNGTVPSNAIYSSYTAEFTRVGEFALANAFAAAYSNDTAAALTARVLSNLGVTAATIGATSYATLASAVETAFASFPTARGQVALNLARLLTGLETDATYGAAATAFNNNAAVAFTYSSNVANTTSTTLAALNAPVSTTRALTTGLDTFTGTSSDDTFTAFVSGTANASTLTAGDQIAGGAGNDTLSITIDSNAAANAMSPQISSVESVTIRNLSDAANLDNLNLLLATGVTSVTLTNSAGTGDTEVTNAPLSATYGISSTPAAVAGGAIADLTVTFNAADITGTADTARFSAAGAGSKAATAGPDRAILDVGNTSGVEAVSVATSGTNFITINGGGNDTKTVSVTGNGTNNISLAGVNQTVLLDASASTGSNTFVMGAELTSSDTIRGGTGSDTISISAGDATSVSISGVETLRVENGGTVDNLSFAAATTGTALEVRDVGANVLRFGNFQPSQIAFVGASTVNGSTFGLGVATNAVDFAPVRLDTAYAGTNDTVTMSIGNQGVTALAAPSASLNVSGVENVVINQADASAAVTAAYTLSISGLKTVAVTTASAATLTLNTAASNVPGYTGSAVDTSGNTVTLVDLSGVAGTSSVSMGISKGTFASAAEVRASVGGTTITFGEEASTDTITFTGNAAADSVTTGAGGRFVANLGAGNDTFTAASLSSTVGGSVTVDGGDGNDTITGSYAADSLTGGLGNDSLVGGNGADTISGGDGNDTITGGNGADVIDGGAGLDTYILAAGAAAVPGTNQVSVLYPVALASGFLNVTIGGNTYSTAYNTSIAQTLADFVTNHAVSVKAVTGGATNGVVVTANATQLVFTAQGTNTTSNGVMTATGYTFTAPTSTVTSGANSGNTVGRVVTNAFNSYTVTPAAAFDAAGETFSIGGVTVTFDTSVANSLALFAAANPTVGSYAVRHVAGENFLTLFSSSTATGTATATAPTSAAGTGASGVAAATVGAATDVSATESVAGVSAALPTASASSYLVTGASGAQTISNNIDQLTYVTGDTIQVGSVTIARASTSAGDANTATIDNATGIATFGTAPANFNAALAQVAAGIAVGGTTAGESVVFQYGGKTYIYVADAADAHSAADIVVEVVGAPATLTTGITISSGTITGLG